MDLQVVHPIKISIERNMYSGNSYKQTGQLCMSFRSSNMDGVILEQYPIIRNGQALLNVQPNSDRRPM